jgi:GNAT superfamily N-acetyltransferase
MRPTSPLAALPDEPYVRWVIGDRPVDDLEVDGANAAWLEADRRRGESWVTGMGPRADTVAGLVVDLARRHDPDGITVPDPSFTLLPADLRSPDHGYWSFWTFGGDTARLDPGSAVVLAPDDPRIAPLLTHSSSAHVLPGHPRIVRWTGVLDDEDLIGVAATIAETSGAQHVVSVCTHPGARGRGVAAQTCGLLVRLADDDGAPMVVLEMYAGNDAARRTYQRVGFDEVRRFRSGLLAGRPRSVRGVGATA